MTRRLQITLTGLGIIFITLAVLFGDNMLQQVQEPPVPQNVQPILVSEIPPDDFPLAENNDCFDCHGMERKNIGPSFRDIAARYQDEDSARLAMIEIVSNGGKGNWTDVTGGVLMPPYSQRLSGPEIERVVDWILGL